MTATLEVLAAGVHATVQDLGRPGLRRLGVPSCGALDPWLLRVANALVGNAEDAAAIEFFLAGPTLRATNEPVQLGLAGDFSAVVTRADGNQRKVDAWRSMTLWPGDTLRAGTTRSTRVGMIAVRALEVPHVLGSASTYTRARFGGHHGRALATGDMLTACTLPMSSGMRHRDQVLHQRWTSDQSAIRVVLGPQDDHFDSHQIGTFLGETYEVTTDADRMGVRLRGPALVHNTLGSEIVSDATVPGSIQVPGTGLPIVLLADGQTAGGYPKIATVISADIRRIACAPIGAAIRFEAVTVSEAEAIARENEARLRRILASMRPIALSGDIDIDAIYATELVSGMVDALDPR